MAKKVSSKAGRILFGCLLVTMGSALASCGGSSSNSLYTDEASGVVYAIYDDHAAVHSFLEGHEEVTVSRVASGKVVNRILSNVNGNCGDIKTLSFEETISSFTIEANAFKNSSSLETVNFEGTGSFVIESYAFADTVMLNTVTFGGSAVYDLYSWSFAGSGYLETINFDNTTSGNKIGESAFSGCGNLSHALFTESSGYVLDKHAFDNCPNLSDFAIGQASISYVSDYCAFSRDNPPSITIDGGSLSMYDNIKTLTVKSGSDIEIMEGYYEAGDEVEPVVEMAIFEEGFDFGDHSITHRNTGINIFSPNDQYEAFANAIFLPSTITKIPDGFLGNSKTSSLHYAGSQQEWDALPKGANNDNLTNGNISFHYDSSYAA